MTSPSLSRRGLITAAGLGAGVALTPAWMADAARSAAVDADTLWRWNHLLADGGPRLTGNAAHRHFVDWLAAKFARTGLKVHRDRHTFTRWAPRRWSLTVAGEPIDVAYYFPYSGETPPGGVTGKLVHLGLSPTNAVAWGVARGKIAVVEVASPQLPIGAAFPSTGHFPPAAKQPLLAPAPSITDIAVAPLLELAHRAGVLGVVCIRTGVSDALAKDQYSPFTTGHQGCPALWVGPTAGKRLRTLARAGARATLTLDAQLIPNAATDTIWAVLPGSDPREAVVVNTHTDGPNVAEENGGLGLLALAREFSRVPRSRRRRSLIFVATTGHFQIPQLSTGALLAQSASRWIADHPELLDGRSRKTVAALTLEHLGCREWADDPRLNRYRATGLNDVGFCYTSNNRMRRLYLRNAAGTANRRTFTVAPPPALYFGEGHDFYKKRIATMSLIPAPSYLVAAPRNGAIEKLDKHLMLGQVRTFAKVIRSLDELSARQIGTSTGL
ncbi:hypothetical protein EFK50_04320 [Nocardioides marmoriginsengisoli]|uniref:M28 family peptidase n=1 Tax=Nocardioides marmoriginsengisoli TaxID=661483 RepID=A0A3N0CNZ4_9ACTN|nr:hypothetical protein [Nocardioides marmoriginsengisoli]RNL65197.1 hypothetical protein EFK50_04320 [Nocardioides marmoriginsengisoli]